MLIYYLFSSILFNFITSSHNCNFSNGKWSHFENELIDYQISCPSYNIQRVDLKNSQNVNNISIFGDFNVIITCSPNEDDFIHTVLSLYDTPTITFENICNFNRLEIHGFPILRLFNKSYLSVNNLILANQTYQFPFKYNRVIYSKCNSKRSKSHDNFKTQKISQNQIYECNNSSIEAILKDNYAILKCGNLYEYTLFYSMFSNNIFNINSSSLSITNLCSSDINVNQNIRMFLPLIQKSDDIEVFFQKFSQLKSIENYTNDDKKGTWLQIGDDHKCLWENVSYKNKEFENYFKRGWKRVCLNSQTFLYCCDTDLGSRKVIVISKWGFLAIIIVIICFIIALIITFCIISYHRYTDSRKVS